MPAGSNGACTRPFLAPACQRVNHQPMGWGRATRKHRVAKIKSGPLPIVDWRQLEPPASFEARLPTAFVVAFVALMAVQIWLHL